MAVTGSLNSKEISNQDIRICKQKFEVSLPSLENLPTPRRKLRLVVRFLMGRNFSFHLNSSTHRCLMQSRKIAGSSQVKIPVSQADPKNTLEREIFPRSRSKIGY